MAFSIDNILDVLSYLDSGIGILFFALIYILTVIFILPASFLSFLAGFLYGSYLGSIIVFLSAFIGASISFLIAKEFLSIRIQKIVSKFSNFSLLENIIKRAGLKLIILTRLSPVFPFSILNYFYGLNKISYKDFSLGLLFIFPGSFLYCSIGSLANNLYDLKTIKVNNNIITSIVSIVSTAFVVYFLAKYSNEVIKESAKNQFFRFKSFNVAKIMNQ